MMIVADDKHHECWITPYLYAKGVAVPDEVRFQADVQQTRRRATQETAKE
jgi:hypothetical protein